MYAAFFERCRTTVGSSSELASSMTSAARWRSSVMPIVFMVRQEYV
jgi:hypothetical protein